MTLVHPQMLSQMEAAGFFPASCDIQAQASGKDAYGVPNGAWANVAGLTGLACSLHASPQMIGSTRQEDKLPDQTVTTGILRVVFAGRHEGITSTHRAVIGGTTYDIVTVNTDAYDALTELLVQRVAT